MKMMRDSTHGSNNRKETRQAILREQEVHCLSDIDDDEHSNHRRLSIHGTGQRSDSRGFVFLWASSYGSIYCVDWRTVVRRREEKRMKFFAWIASALAALAGLFSVKKRIEDAAIRREKKKVEKAVRFVESQLAKSDRQIDEQTAEKIKAIKKATTEILEKKQATGADANAMIRKVRGRNRD